MSDVITVPVTTGVIYEAYKLSKGCSALRAMGYSLLNIPCAVELAVARALDAPCSDVHAGYSTVCVRAEHYAMTGAATKYINQFDSAVYQSREDLLPEPFTVTLQVLHG